jgi:hypothetical protein
MKVGKYYSKIVEKGYKNYKITNKGVSTGNMEKRVQ